MSLGEALWRLEGGLVGNTLGGELRCVLGELLGNALGVLDMDGDVLVR